MEGLEPGVLQYHHDHHQYQHHYPGSAAGGPGPGRHLSSPVGSDHGSSLGARSVGGREEASAVDTGAAAAGAAAAAAAATATQGRRRAVAMSRAPVDQVRCGRGFCLP